MFLLPEEYEQVRFTAQYMVSMATISIVHVDSLGSEIFPVQLTTKRLSNAADDASVYSYWLNLKPLSAITKEDINGLMVNECKGNKDAEKLLKFVQVGIEAGLFSAEDYGKNLEPMFEPGGVLITKVNYFKATGAVDYLRSCGYLVPWNGYSTKEILEKGWAKLV